MAELVDDACRLLDELGPSPVIWVGLSLGGMVGLELALRQPHRIKALVMANACAGYDAVGQQLWQQRIQAVAGGGMAVLADGAMQRWFSSDFQQRAPATLARARRRLLSTDASAYAATCHALSQWNATERLPALQTPTLLLAGSADTATPPAMSEVIGTSVPGATLHVLDGAAHLSVLEQPLEFHRVLRAWLGALDGGVS
jgi:3-oxoadipate enol-lactonase